MDLDQRLRQKVAAYKPSRAALAPILSEPFLIMCGITGAGKDAVIRNLLATFPNDYQFVVTHVTRRPRSNSGIMERDGVDYHFIDFTTADRMLDAGEYIEANIVHDRDIYGATIAAVKHIKDAGKIALSDITIQGVDNFVDLGLNVRPVFLLPPSYEVWRQRLANRGAMGNEELRRRLQSAITEITHALALPHYYIVINDHLSTTAKLVNSIGHGEPVEPRYKASVAVAQTLLKRIKAELAALGE